MQGKDSELSNFILNHIFHDLTDFQLDENLFSFVNIFSSKLTGL